MKCLSILALAPFLAACGLSPAKPPPVLVPVAVGCLGPVPARPVPKFGTGPYPGDKVAAQVALTDYADLGGYATALEVAQAGCDPKPAAQVSAKKP